MTAVPPLILAPDIEKLISAFLRATPEVAAFCDDRVYADPPAAKRAYPLVLVQRAGGGPVLTAPAWLDQAIVHLWCLGGRHTEAERLAATCCAALAQRLRGAWPGHAAVVTKVAVTDFGYDPDPDAEITGTARPRYRVSVTVTSHPA